MNEGKKKSLCCKDSWRNQQKATSRAETRFLALMISETREKYHGNDKKRRYL